MSPGHDAVVLQRYTIFVLSGYRKACAHVFIVQDSAWSRAFLMSERELFAHQKSAHGEFIPHYLVVRLRSADFLSVQSQAPQDLPRIFSDHGIAMTWRLVYPALKAPRVEHRRDAPVGEERCASAGSSPSPEKCGPFWFGFGKMAATVVQLFLDTKSAKQNAQRGRMEHHAYIRGSIGGHILAGRFALNSSVIITHASLAKKSFVRGSRVLSVHVVSQSRLNKALAQIVGDGNFAIHGYVDNQWYFQTSRLLSPSPFESDEHKTALLFERRVIKRRTLSSLAGFTKRPGIFAVKRAPDQDWLDVGEDLIADDDEYALGLGMISESTSIARDG
ncbi:hypothetical protein CCUS01_10410 [Colletotrichum cuscutae]|uniref:Uncharacterized protein n=1 Tax=Colletotrichum cuscutae TaxID=1209917 RepID=A0AAI9XMZ0_9PEZI|nr:hypothetical protein CCUS01_10410 [Colletotrichum cuscutae]